MFKKFELKKQHMKTFSKRLFKIAIFAKKINIEFSIDKLSLDQFLEDTHLAEKVNKDYEANVFHKSIEWLRERTQYVISFLDHEHFFTEEDKTYLAD